LRDTLPGPLPPAPEAAASAPARQSADERFHVETSRLGDLHVIVAVGELDAAAVPILEEEILSSLTEAPAIMLDLDRLTFIDSCGLWLITLTLSSCRRTGVDFTLTRGPQPVRAVFEVTGLSDVLPFSDEPTLP
jgi:anti-anti-sigma factor